jgi:inorganic pyrophosphatase/exopolyphosphatase
LTSCLIVCQQSIYVNLFKMKILITCSKKPDVDGVACSIALSQYYNLKNTDNEYEYGFQSYGHIEGKYVLEELRIDYKLINSSKKYDKFILTDLSEIAGMPEIVTPEDVVEVIDHRLFPEYDNFPQAKFRVEPVGAAATQIAELYYFDNLKPSVETSQLLACAIVSNTNNFLANTTTFRDRRIFNWLINKCNATQDFTEKMLAFKTQYTLENLDEVLISDLKTLPAYQFFQLEVLDSRDIRTVLESGNLLTRLANNKSYVLAIQDMKAGKTYFQTNDLYLDENLATQITTTKISNFHEFDKIYMRKTIIPIIGKIQT